MWLLPYYYQHVVVLIGYGRHELEERIIYDAVLRASAEPGNKNLAESVIVSNGFAAFLAHRHFILFVVLVRYLPSGRSFVPNT